MKNNTLFLPGFHFATLRKKPRSASQKFADEIARIKRHSISQLGECFGSFIPTKELDNTSKGAFSRRRLFSKTNTFWAFFSQVLDADGGCREAIRKVQALAASRSLKMPSSSTSAYCQARAKLPKSTLRNILDFTSEKLRNRKQSCGWKERRVIVVDGTGVSMSDTEENQQVWPQMVSQKPGCGFPQARICACFCLQTGGLLSYQIGHRKNHELPLLRQQWDSFETGDIFLGDKGYCSYYDIWKFQQKGVDSVITLARRSPVEEASALKKLGKDDLLISWPKPAWNKNLSYDKTDWEALPAKLVLRQIKVTVKEPGFRVQSFYIITTLTDVDTYPANDIADLYYQRWDVELFFRDIKTTIGMDILRCKTPDMVEKEIHMHFIVYNSIRMLMLDAANEANVNPREISFKASIQAMRQWEPQINRDRISDSERRRIMALLRESIADAALLIRPGRREPRAVKRRPKPFALLTAHRHEMIEIPHRNKYRAKAA